MGRTLASGHWKDQRVNSSLQEIESQKRFGFGKNWGRFLRVLNNERIEEAERSLREMLEIDDLTGKSFLDVGSGSGLFSLAARRLGARPAGYRSGAGQYLGGAGSGRVASRRHRAPY